MPSPLPVPELQAQIQKVTCSFILQHSTAWHSQTASAGIDHCMQARTVLTLQRLQAMQEVKAAMVRLLLLA